MDVDTRVDVVHNATILHHNNHAVLYEGQTADSSLRLDDYLTPGEFFRIGGQEFRVCLNQDADFQAQYGEYNATRIPLCTVENAWIAATFDAGFEDNVRYGRPIYKLDTVVGGAQGPTMGASYVNVQQLADSVAGNNEAHPELIKLDAGDWVMVGHPTDGEVFRVQGRTLYKLLLADANQGNSVTTSGSLSLTALQHATYEVQEVTFTCSGGGCASFSDSKGTGFRLDFDRYDDGYSQKTYVTEAGGYYGCLVALPRKLLLSLLSSWRSTR